MADWLYHPDLSVPHTPAVFPGWPSPAFFPCKKTTQRHCIVNTAYVIGPPLQHRVLKLSYAFWAPVNTTYVKFTSSGAQPVNIF